jgi:DNA-binding beta-propeller fold protein YncE
LLRAGGPFNYPTDVAMSHNGEFYVSDGDRNCAVHKFSAEGKYLFSWGAPGDGPGQFNRPHSVWEADGRVYVADRNNNRIQIFTPEGKYLDQWGGFVQPAKIYVDRNGVMYVAELKGRVSILDLKGNVLARWGDPVTRALDVGMFAAAHSLWVDSRGDFYVGEVFKAKRIQKFVHKR